MSYHSLWEEQGTSGKTWLRKVDAQSDAPSEIELTPQVGHGTFVNAQHQFVLWSSAGECARTLYGSATPSTAMLVGVDGFVCVSLVMDGSVWRMAWSSLSDDSAKVCTFGVDPEKQPVPSGAGWGPGSCKSFSLSSGSDWRFHGYVPRPQG